MQRNLDPRILDDSGMVEEKKKESNGDASFSAEGMRASIRNKEMRIFDSYERKEFSTIKSGGGGASRKDDNKENWIGDLSKAYIEQESS